MNKFLSLIALTLLLGTAFAGQTTQDDFDNDDDLFDTIAGGDEEFEFIRYTPEFIQMSINEDMKVACKKGMCTLFTIANNGDEFKIEFNVGYGEQNNSGGSVVIVPGASYSSPSREYVGLTASYSYKTCQQDIKVPRSLYIAMNTYMFGLITEEGSTRRAFTPADEAMIIFYSTIIKQANGCN
ncbi:MAG: hypothetical protein KAG61_05680 [Bacteriovoracaceae bacterium]|nr:hypothetical protein [Bacteriovoracaceae bacterium]